MLRDEGLVDARQGFGWFAAGDPLRQRLGRLGTIEDQLAASGVRSERGCSTSRSWPPAPVRRVLGVDKVLRVRRLNLADGEPFALVTVWCPRALGADLSRADVERSSVLRAARRAARRRGADHRRRAASADDADLLGVPAGSPVLRCERITYDADGRPVLFSEHVFPGHLTEFVVDLPRMERVDRARAGCASSSRATELFRAGGVGRLA